jgi:hypothetical protein
MFPRLVLALAVLGLSIQAPPRLFRHHFVHREPPEARPAAPGYGSPALADFDKDGDLDFVALRRGPAPRLLRFENRGEAGWAAAEAGDMPLGQLGSLAIDVDGDGWTDILMGGFWFRNESGKIFERRRYDASIKTEIHDIAAGDIDGDGKDDIAVLGDREGCFWYRIPAEPLRESDWSRSTITLEVLDDKDDIHGGLAPRGLADLDGDKDLDVALTDRWLENRKHGAEWVRHPLPWGKRGPWGLSSRSWILDLDGDGDNDIVVADCDQQDSRIAWLENDGARTPTFRLHMIADAAPNTRGSFHSLVVADFDGDRDPDILTVEQEDPKILPGGVAPRWFLWVNLGGGRFREQVVLDERLGGHDVQLGDIDGDGDPDLASKVWSRWPGNANAGLAHVDWLENLRR